VKWRLQIFESLDSTQTLCRDMAEDGEPSGLAILARSQTSGRGTHGRPWVSQPGNLFLSVLIRPGSPRSWSLLAGVALADAVAGFLPDTHPLTLKWPNDLLIHRRKCAGILAEQSADAMVIGFGVNLAGAPEGFAAVAELVPPPTPVAFAEALLARLDVRLAQDWREVRDAWLSYAPAIGTEMHLTMGDKTLTGAFAGIAENGHLLLMSGGREQKYAAGEVRLAA
jgi:BirA family biotin operon repressor/biotin-[acetyl-CoA-carboxylase] ligase